MSVNAQDESRDEGDFSYQPFREIFLDLIAPVVRSLAKGQAVEQVRTMYLTEGLLKQRGVATHEPTSGRRRRRTSRV